jgi:hypothetical protein
MKRKLFIKALVPLAAVAATVGVALPASAATCASLNLPSPLLLVGSTAIANLVQTMAVALANATPPVSIIYSNAGSCGGMNIVFSSTTATPVSIGMGSATYYPANLAAGTAPPTCTLNMEPASVFPQVALSDVSYLSCYNPNPIPALPAGIGEFVGPIQTMNLIVPQASTASSISAEAAYFVFGFPNGGGVAPWGGSTVTSDANIFMRGPASGTQSMIAVAIGVRPDKWAANSTDPVTMATLSSGGMLKDAVGAATAANANATIGILSSDVVEGSANVSATTGMPLVKGLAFQGHGQECPWYPNSAAGTHDKQNVRDGHYILWGAERFYAPVGTNGVPTNALAAQFVALFNAATPAAMLPFPGGYKDVLTAEINNVLIPQCAMKVQRAGNLEIGPMTSYAPTCECLFDSLKKTGGTTCGVCTTDTDCKTASATHCRYGYCEAN